MLAFDIPPFVGALPIQFGFSRAKVHALLGIPESTLPVWDGSGTTDFWSLTQQPDPNPEFLSRDPAPFESLGILVFPRLGVTTTGYHDEDENQRALAVFPQGAWDPYLQEAGSPDLSKYRS